MNVRQQQARVSKISMRNLDLRGRLWPDLDVALLWNRKIYNGFTTIPRPMPQINHIIDHLAPKAKPVSQTYLSLWCRVFDESFVTIQNEKEVAFEAGFTSQRSVTSWHSRIKILIDLRFIDAKAGSAGRYQYILLYNPYLVINNLKDKIPEPLFIALFARAQEVGAEEDLI